MADVLNDRLPAFLRAAVQKRPELGRHDHGLILADWLRVARGAPDVAADVRERYGDEKGFAAICAVPWPRVLARRLRHLGLRRTADPMSGDIAVVRGPAGFFGAIRSGDGWAALGPTGLIWTRSPVRVIAAWRVEQL